MPSRLGLKRELNLLDMTMLGLGAIIGSGWLYASQRAAKLAGPAALLSWIIGGICILLIALVYSEMGAMLPEAGGMVRYPQYTHGNFVSYIISFACIIAYSTVVAIEAEAVVQYLSSYIPSLFSHGQMHFVGWLMTLLFIVIFFLLNYFSVRIFAKVNTVVTILKFLTPLLTVIVLFTAFHGANLSYNGSFMPFGWPGVFSAVSTAGIVFSFLGFRQAVDMAGEAKNPQRNVPLSIILAVLIGIVLYFFLQMVFLGGLTSAQLANGWGKISLSAPFADLAAILGFGWLSVILHIDALVSPAGTGNIYSASTSRVILAQAENRMWYRIFLRVDQKSGVPRPALWLTLALACFWTLPFPTWSAMVGVTSGAVVFTYMVGPVSAFAFRRIAPNLKRPFVLKGMGVIALIGFIVGTLLIFWTGWHDDLIIVAVNLGSLILYFAFIDSNEEARRDLARQWKGAIWLVVYMIFLLVVSCLGSFGGYKIIPYPWDMIVAMAGAVCFFYWGSSSAFVTADLQKVLDEEAKGQSIFDEAMQES